MSKLEQQQIETIIREYPTLCTWIAKGVSLGATSEALKVIVAKNTPPGAMVEMCYQAIDFFLSDIGRGLLAEFEAHRQRTSRPEPETNGADYELDQMHAGAPSPYDP